jgi:hypothetical protein
MDKLGYCASSHTHTHTTLYTHARTGIRGLSHREQQTQAKFADLKAEIRRENVGASSDRTLMFFIRNRPLF